MAADELLQLDPLRVGRVGVEEPCVVDQDDVVLDLQGAEPEALEGMGSLWERCTGLILEVSYGEDGTYEPLRATLAARGFAEASTLNELETDEGVLEADRLFVKAGP